MPSTLITDWKKIGQSGPTVDGRMVDPQWLEEAAESYNLNVYTAVITVEHMKYFGNYGKVVALKTETGNEGIVSLFAKLQPNDRLLSLNRDSQKLFTSMELTPNFAETGGYYMSGLAVTDIPAQLGTQELHFNHRKQAPDNIIFHGVELGDIEAEAITEHPDESLLVRAFSRALKGLGFNTPTNQGAPPEPEEDTMTDEQMKQFAEIVGDSVGKRLDGLKEDLDQKFAAMNPGEPADKGSGDGASPDDGQQSFSAEIAEAMKPFTEKLDELQKEFSDKVEDLTKRFEQVNPGTQAPESTQPADAVGADYL